MKKFDRWLQEEGEQSAEKEIGESREILKLRAKLNAANRKVKRLVDEIDTAEDRLVTALRITEPATGRVDPLEFHSPSKARTQLCPVLVCSDWHVEEVVERGQVNGLNEYNLKIAEERAFYLIRGALYVIDSLRSGYEINTLVLPLLGDLITGYLREEDLETNSLSPTEATMFCLDLLIGCIDQLLSQGGFERITIPTAYGNHGRTTQRRRIASLAKNSYEWLMYQALRRHYEKDDRVDIVISEGSMLYTEIYGRTFRWHHGDDVRYYGGVGGLTIPFRKKVFAWNEYRDAYSTVIGHYHALADYGYGMVNGSLIGVNPYALSIGASGEPPRQLLFFVDERWGKRFVTPIYCDTNKARE